MNAPYIIKTESGDELVILSRKDYDDLLSRARSADDAEDAVLFAEGREVMARRERGEEGVVVVHPGTPRG